MNHDDLSAFLEDQMGAIKTIITGQDEDSDEGPQIQYDDSAYKSIESLENSSKESFIVNDSTKNKLKALYNLVSPSKTIMEEEESKEASLMATSGK